MLLVDHIDIRNDLRYLGRREDIVRSYISYVQGLKMACHNSSIVASVQYFPSLSALLHAGTGHPNSRRWLLEGLYVRLDVLAAGCHL